MISNYSHHRFYAPSAERRVFGVRANIEQEASAAFAFGVAADLDVGGMGAAFAVHGFRIGLGRD